MSQEAIAGQDRVGHPHAGSKAAQTPRLLGGPGGIAVAEKHRVVEIEQQHPRRSPQQPTLPPRQQAALKHHRMGSGNGRQLAKEAGCGAGQDQRLQVPAFAGQDIAERLQPVAETDMLRRFDQRQHLL